MSADTSVRVYIHQEPPTWLDHAAQTAAHKIIVRCGYPHTSKSHSCQCVAAMKVIRTEVRRAMVKANVSEEPK